MEEGGKRGREGERRKKHTKWVRIAYMYIIFPLVGGKRMFIGKEKGLKGFFFMLQQAKERKGESES